MLFFLVRKAFFLYLPLSPNTTANTTCYSCRFIFERAFFVYGCFRAEQEAKITSEKDAHIKSVEAEILQLKADIYNLKDVYRKYSMYGKFLAAISPEDWRKEQV